jgi:hypothetical protein
MAELFPQSGQTAWEAMRSDKNLGYPIPFGFGGSLDSSQTVFNWGAAVPVVSRRDQVRLLHAAGRAKDLEDARTLESLEDD